MKGLFVTEIVRALRDGEVDLAVHSAKDLPAGIEAEDEQGLVIAAVPERASALDVLVTRDGDLRPGARVGTSSIRRRAQVFRLRPDVLIQDLRGNVDTRLRKLEDGEADALILAAAGLLRLGVVPARGADVALGDGARAGSGVPRGPGSRVRRRDDRGPVGARPCAEQDGARDGARPDGPSRRRVRFHRRVRRTGSARRAADRDRALSPDGSRIARTEVDGATPQEVAALAALDLSAGGADEILGLVRP